MGWWLVLGRAQPRQVPSEVVPTQNHPEGEPWAFTTGDPQRAIAALELFGLLLLVRAVLLCAAGSAFHTRILVASDNQGKRFLPA